MIVTVLAFFVSLIIALVCVPMFDRLARRVGLVDQPDKLRKLHENAIPMVGGMTLFVATPIAVLVACYVGVQHIELVGSLTKSLSNWLPIESLRNVLIVTSKDFFQLLGLLIGSALLLAVGLADDRWGIRGRQKLLGQFVAVTVLILFGYQFDHIGVAGQKINFGVFSILVIYAWVIAAINSVNLLDGADGIAATIGIVMSIAIALMSLIQGKPVDAVVAASIAGALLGFLKFNFPPARAYLGDSGSMLIGFLLSALAIRCMFKQNSAYAFFAPVALLAIPFIDTAAAIIRRRLTGRSIFAVDRGHLHHALMKRGYSPRISLLWVALLCSTTAGGAILSLINHQVEYALASIFIVLVVMIGCKIFGVAEYQLVSRKAGSVAKSFFLTSKDPENDVLQSSVHVQGSRNWEEIWKELGDFADQYQLNQLTLDLNAPWLHESFHATRRRSGAKRGETQEWFTLIPLVAQGRAFGRIEIHGSHDGPFNHHETIAATLLQIEMIEKTVMDPLPAAAPTGSSATTKPNSTQPAGTSA